MEPREAYDEPKVGQAGKPVAVDCGGSLIGVSVLGGIVMVSVGLIGDAEGGWHAPPACLFALAKQAADDCGLQVENMVAKSPGEVPP